MILYWLDLRWLALQVSQRVNQGSVVPRAPGVSQFNILVSASPPRVVDPSLTLLIVKIKVGLADALTCVPDILVTKYLYYLSGLCGLGPTFASLSSAVLAGLALNGTVRVWQW